MTSFSFDFFSQFVWCTFPPSLLMFYWRYLPFYSIPSPSVPFPFLTQCRILFITFLPLLSFLLTFFSLSFFLFFSGLFLHFFSFWRFLYFFFFWCIYLIIFFSQFDRYQALLNNKKGPNFPLAITLAAEEQSDPSEVRTFVPHTVWKCHCSSV